MTRYMVWGVISGEINACRVSKNPRHLYADADTCLCHTSKECPAHLHFSDGTILDMWEEKNECDPFGFWRIEVKKQGSAGVVIVPAEPDDLKINTDVAFVTGLELVFDTITCGGEEILS